MIRQKKIVLLQLISNGDCLYATAVARQIKQDYPDCHLTWAIASFCKNIIDNNPYVDIIWELPEVSKNNCLEVLRKLRKDLQQKKINGDIDEVFLHRSLMRIWPIMMVAFVRLYSVGMANLLQYL